MYCKKHKGYRERFEIHSLPSKNDNNNIVWRISKKCFKILENEKIFQTLDYSLKIIICFPEKQSNTRTTDAQRGNSLHCTAENSIPIPNF